MPVRRIVSLVPSLTELLSDLGLDDEVVGITRFCVHPEHWRQTKALIGGTKNVRLDLVDSLKPDLIVANKEENTKEDIGLLMKKHKVWVSDVKTADDAYAMILRIGDLTETRSRANEIVSNIKSSFDSIPWFEPRKALYLIWKKPWMAAGKDTFIHEMMKMSGFENVVVKDRYPSLTEDDIRKLDPGVVLLSSEPYPFKDQHVDELKKLLPASTIMLVDGEMFSWYGSRMKEMAGYFQELRSVF